MKSNLVEGEDFRLIHEDGWDILKRRFGLATGCPPLPRNVYETGSAPSRWIKEVEGLQRRPL